jgi:hypothetical protein
MIARRSVSAHGPAPPFPTRVLLARPDSGCCSTTLPSGEIGTSGFPRPLASSFGLRLARCPRPLPALSIAWWPIKPRVRVSPCARPGGCTRLAGDLGGARTPCDTSH